MEVNMFNHKDFGSVLRIDIHTYLRYDHVGLKVLNMDKFKGVSTIIVKSSHIYGISSPVLDDIFFQLRSNYRGVKTIMMVNVDTTFLNTLHNWIIADYQIENLYLINCKSTILGKEICFPWLDNEINFKHLKKIVLDNCYLRGNDSLHNINIPELIILEDINQPCHSCQDTTCSTYQPNHNLYKDIILLPPDIQLIIQKFLRRPYWHRKRKYNSYSDFKCYCMDS
jgi:hypothetical protein